MTPDEYVQYLKDNGYALDAPESESKDEDKELEPLAQRLKKKLESMTQEELQKKWDELNHYNDNCPTIDETVGFGAVSRTSEEIKEAIKAARNYISRLEDELHSAYEREFEEKMGIEKGDTVYTFNGEKYRYVGLDYTSQYFVRVNPVKKDSTFAQTNRTILHSKFTPETIHGENIKQENI